MLMQETPVENWEYKPGRAAIAEALATAPQHYMAIRAAAPPGDKPTEGGPSWPLSSRSIAAFEFAAGAARGYWPEEKNFELISAEVRYDPKRIETLQLPPGCTLLRHPAVLIPFTVA